MRGLETWSWEQGASGHTAKCRYQPTWPLAGRRREDRAGQTAVGFCMAVRARRGVCIYSASDGQ